MVRDYVIYTQKVDHHLVAVTRESSLFQSRNARVVPTRSFPLLLYATVLEPLKNRSVFRIPLTLAFRLTWKYQLKSIYEQPSSEKQSW